jgi:hypothetical protein
MLEHDLLVADLDLQLGHELAAHVVAHAGERLVSCGGRDLFGHVHDYQSSRVVPSTIQQ